MVTIVLNPMGFLRIAALRKGGKLNAEYYISEILASLAERRAGQVVAADRKLIVHSDDARPPPAKRVNDCPILRTRQILHDVSSSAISTISSWDNRLMMHVNF
jgi:hypothetical protein